MSKYRSDFYNGEFSRTKLTFEQRAVLAKAEPAKKLFHLMACKKTNLCLAAELSNSGSLIDAKYSEAANKIATEGADIDFVAGVVCQSVKCFNFPGLVQLTPGVKIDDSADKLGQQYETPEHVVKERGADIGVVGRGILQAKSVEKAAALYRDRLWAAYTDRIAIE